MSESIWIVIQQRLRHTAVLFKTLIERVFSTVITAPLAGCPSQNPLFKFRVIIAGKMNDTLYCQVFIKFSGLLGCSWDSVEQQHVMVRRKDVLLNETMNLLLPDSEDYVVGDKLTLFHVATHFLPFVAFRIEAPQHFAHFEMVESG